MKNLILGFLLFFSLSAMAQKTSYTIQLNEIDSLLYLSTTAESVEGSININ